MKKLVACYYKNRGLFIMLLPALAFLIIFSYLPIYGIVISFVEYYPKKGILGSEWVGMKYFEQIFRDRYFWLAFRNTIIISFLKILFGFPAPIILAILLNEIKNGKAKKIFQTITYMPHFISWVVLAGILKEFLSPSRGAINIILKALGAEPIFFLANAKWFRTVLVASSVWQEVGWGSIIYLAAITNIDPELYDVANIDGAGALRKIWNITIPCIMPTIVICGIMKVGGIVGDDFQQIYNLLNDSVIDVGQVIGTYTYERGFVNMQYSYSTAVGLFRNIIAFTLVMLTNYLAKKATDGEMGIL